MVTRKINDDITLAYLLNKTLERAYPVGSIYMSMSPTDPSTLFGGKWEQIQNTFLLAAGSSYPAGSTGGEATVKLGFENYQSFVWNPSMPMESWDVATAFNGGSDLGIKVKYSDNINTPHNNMPPYLTVYMWQRVA